MPVGVQIPILSINCSNNKVVNNGEEENTVTACTDASNVYGSGEEGRLESIADMETGMLKTDSDLLPPKGACPMVSNDVVLENIWQ